VYTVLACNGHCSPVSAMPNTYPSQEAIIDTQPSSYEDSVGPSPGSNISNINHAVSFPGSPTQCSEYDFLFFYL